MADGYFKNARGEQIFKSDVEDVTQEYKGTTLDGDPIYHVTYYDPHRRLHVSYDVVAVIGIQHYVRGSGYDNDHNTNTETAWEPNSKHISWYEAQNYRTWELIS